MDATRRRAGGQACSAAEPLKLFDDADFSIGKPLDAGGEHDERENVDVSNERQVREGNSSGQVEAAVRPRASHRVESSAARQAPPATRPECRSDVRGGPSSSADAHHGTQPDQLVLNQPDAHSSAVRYDEESTDDDGDRPADRAPRLVTILRAAELLGVGRTTGYELVAAGELEVVHIGRSARIPIESIDAYVMRLREAARPPSRGVRVRMQE